VIVQNIQCRTESTWLSFIFGVRRGTSNPSQYKGSQLRIVVGKMGLRIIMQTTAIITKSRKYHAPAFLLYNTDRKESEKILY
jgi:hypothetical protein